MQSEGRLIAMMPDIPSEDAHLVEVEGQAGPERAENGDILRNLVVGGGGLGVDDFGEHICAYDSLAFGMIVIADVDASARIFREEIFGPVLAVTAARNFEHALELANDSEYGLTGAVYTRNPEKLQRARDRFFVGNLYINRKCTGAMVGAHPFGGFNMSGTDSKAGGPDYMQQFVQAKSIALRVS